MVTILMSAKMATQVHDVATNKILSHDLNSIVGLVSFVRYFVRFVRYRKFGNSSVSMKEVIIN